MEERKKITIEDIQKIQKLLEAKAIPMIEPRPLCFTKETVDKLNKEIEALDARFMFDWNTMRVAGYPFIIIGPIA